MARGWESKSVEAQMESAQADRDLALKRHLTPAQVETLRAKQGLLLARSRVRRDLETSRDPRHQKMLSDALADLDQKLSQLEKSG
jgi:hypothetical protein